MNTLTKDIIVEIFSHSSVYDVVCLFYRINKVFHDAFLTYKVLHKKQITILSKEYEDYLLILNWIPSWLHSQSPPKFFNNNTNEYYKKLNLTLYSSDGKEFDFKVSKKINL